jgi:hypothetical protein
MLWMEKILNAERESGGGRRLGSSPSHTSHGVAALLVATIRGAYERFAAVSL